MKPSCVWVKDTAFTTLLSAESKRLIWARKREVTARPAASSDGLMIREPELNRLRDLDNSVWLAFKLLAVWSASMLVLITIVRSFV